MNFKRLTCAFLLAAPAFLLPGGCADGDDVLWVTHAIQPNGSCLLVPDGPAITEILVDVGVATGATVFPVLQNNRVVPISNNTNLEDPGEVQVTDADIRITYPSDESLLSGEATEKES